MCLYNSFYSDIISHRLKCKLMGKKSMKSEQYCLETYKMYDPKYEELLMANLNKLRDSGIPEVMRVDRLV